MISLAITTYNRSGFVVESFINILDNDFIDEIVIVDDCSDMVIYENLRKLIMRLNHKKIRLIRNKHNIGAFSNKIRAVRRCSNEWVILLDSDNVIDTRYIDIVKRLPMEVDVMYCPESLMNMTNTAPQWSYPELSDRYIDRNNVGSYVDDINYEIHMNSGNSFFNRDMFLGAMSLSDVSPDLLLGCDVSYMTYLWMLSGGRTMVVPGLSYNHRVHDGSFYAQNMEQGISFNAKIYQMMRELKPPQGGFVVNKEFKEMIRTSYDFNKGAYDSDSRWGILEEMYNRNFLHITERENTPIPKKIHQIWLGGAIPDKFRVMTETWRDIHPDWEYKLWTDDDVKNMDLPNRALFDSMINYGPKSDLLRYHIMNEYGGVYADTDFECLKSFYAFTHLGFFTGIGYPSKLELYPGLIGCVPHHSIIEQLVKEVCNIKRMPNDPTGVLETISSYFFTRVFWDVIKGYTEGVAALPPDYFYPFPNDRGYKKRNGRVYIKDCSYAIHHWATAWIL